VEMLGILHCVYAPQDLRGLWLWRWVCSSWHCTHLLNYTVWWYGRLQYDFCAVCSRGTGQISGKKL